jgi:hypothetical protein
MASMHTCLWFEVVATYADIFVGFLNSYTAMVVSYSGL